MKLQAKSLALALAALPLCAAGQDASLGEVRVYGERPAAFRNIPSTTEEVAQPLLEATNVINTEDAVKYLPSIQVRKRYAGDRNAVVASRNSGTIDSARSLVYADNLLVSNLLGNSFAFAPRWWLVMPHEIERIDVSYGPHSAAYAGNSVGAVIVMKTRLPEKFEAHASAQGFTQNFRLYGTDDDFSGSQASASLGNRHGDLRWFLGLNHFENKGHPQSFVTAAPSTTAAGGGDAIVTGFHQDRDPKGAPRVVMGALSLDRTRQDNVKLKLGYDVSPAARFIYTLGNWRNDSDLSIESYLRNAAGNPVYSGGVNIGGKRYTLAATAFQPSLRDEEHRMHSLSYRFDPKGEGEWAWEAALTHYDISKDVTRRPTVALPAASGGGAGQIQRQDGAGWRTADLRVDWRPEAGRRRHEAAFGYHYDRYTLDDRTYSTANWLTGGAATLSSASAGRTETQALYLQDAMRLAPDWKLILGARYERWRAFDGTRSNATATLAYPARQDSAVSPKASLSWQATDDWTLRGALSRAYRWPTVTELFQGTITGTSIVNNDPGLEPEKILSGELAAERDVGAGFLRLSLFQDNFRDALTRQTNTTVTPTVTNVQNVGKVRVRGVETSFRRKDVFLRGLDLVAGLTYADSRILENAQNPASVGKRMLRIPDWRATLAATWRPSDRLDFTLAGRYSGKQHNELDNSDTHRDTFGGASAFLVMDAKLNYRFEQRLALSVGVDNLNNERYYAFHPYPQRTWIARLEFTP